MKKLEQNPGPKWWREGPTSYKSYAIREHSAILIAIWAIYWPILITLKYLYQPLALILIKYLLFFTIIGATGALIHTLTWLAAMPSVLPFNTEKKQTKIILAITIFLIWIIINGGILYLFSLMEI